MSNILVIAPHADDEILGCGGTISKFSKLGYNINVLVITNANKGAPEIYAEKDYIYDYKEFLKYKNEGPRNVSR